MRVRILQAINQPEHANLPIGAILPGILDRELFIGSESTIYRVMKEAKQLFHRGKARRPSHKRPKAFTATGLNDIWCWELYLADVANRRIQMD